MELSFLSDRCLTFNLRGLGCMKISAGSGPIKKSHPTVYDLVELKDMILMLYPCMPLNSYTLYKTGICTEQKKKVNTF